MRDGLNREVNQTGREPPALGALTVPVFRERSAGAGALGLSDRQKFQPVCPSVGDRHNVEQSARFCSKADFAVAADYVRQGVRKSPGIRNSMAPIAGVRGAWTCSLPTQELRKIPQVA